MNAQIKMCEMLVLFLVMNLLPVTLVFAAQSDEKIHQRIMEQISDSALLQDVKVEVHVENRIVVLTGTVQLYEQKLNIEQIAWTTSGVFEVDNKLRIVPKIPLSDEQIKNKIWLIVKADNNFRVSQVKIKVNQGTVTIWGSFVDFRDPSRLKHKVASIEGVLVITINATFLITPIQLNEVAYGSRASYPVTR